MDLGIIQSFKSKYRKYLLQHYYSLFEDNKEINEINLKDAVKFVSLSWDETSKITILNCFKKSRLKEYPDYELTI